MIIEPVSKPLFLNYIFYKWEDNIIPYNVWADTFDTGLYNEMPYKLISAIRFMAEEDIKELKADDLYILEVSRTE